jgi:flagellar basal-body rod modification protein FlgD
MASISSTSNDAAQQVLSNLARTDSASKKTKEEDAQSRFLTLLTTQLKNQDPLNPMDNAQMTSQLAQISTVDGIERLNSTLASLIDGQQSTEAVQAASLVGHGVLVPGSSLVLSDQGAIGGYTLDAAADEVLMSITDSNGLQIAEINLGAQQAGPHSFTWDGTSLNGEPSANGRYRISLTATSGEDAVSASALQLGVVSSVIKGASSVDLEVGSLGIFKMDEIQQIL